MDIFSYPPCFDPVIKPLPPNIISHTNKYLIPL